MTVSLKQAKIFYGIFLFIVQPHSFKPRQIDRQIFPELIILSYISEKTFRETFFTNF